MWTRPSLSLQWFGVIGGRSSPAITKNAQPQQRCGLNARLSVGPYLVVVSLCSPAIRSHGSIHDPLFAVSGANLDAPASLSCSNPGAKSKTVSSAVPDRFVPNSFLPRGAWARTCLSTAQTAASCVRSTQKAGIRPQASSAPTPRYLILFLSALFSLSGPGSDESADESRRTWRRTSVIASAVEPDIESGRTRPRRYS